MRSIQRKMIIFSLLLICGCILFTISGVFGDEQNRIHTPQTITLKLGDTGLNNIERVSLMKAGEYYKDGRANQNENIEFNRNTQEITWNPCNDNACSYISLPTAGGNSGRDELVLEVFATDPSIDVSSCHDDPTCERLLGGTLTKSGMLDGIFYTGRTYEVSIGSLKPGIGETFQVKEISP